MMDLPRGVIDTLHPAPHSVRRDLRRALYTNLLRMRGGAEEMHPVQVPSF